MYRVLDSMYDILYNDTVLDPFWCYTREGEGDGLRFRCRFCGEVFDSQFGVGNHLRGEHSEEIRDEAKEYLSIHI